MIYIKIIITTIVLGILAAGRLFCFMPIVPDFIFCMCTAYSFADKNKLRAVIFSAILAIAGSALTDRQLLYCVIEYSITSLFVCEIFRGQYKLGFVYSGAVTGLFTIVWEMLFYFLYVENKTDFANLRYIILNECVLNFIVSALVYVILFRIFNPRKKSYRISVE